MGLPKLYQLDALTTVTQTLTKAALLGQDFMSANDNGVAGELGKTAIKKENT